MSSGCLVGCRSKPRILEDARAHLRTALTIAEEIFGEKDYEVASARMDLGLVAEAEGDLEQAERELEAALALVEAALPPEHPEIAIFRSHLGPILQAQGKPTAARRQLELALAEGKKNLPSDHRSLWIRHRKLASVHSVLGNQRDARKEAEAALAMSRRTVDADDPRLADDFYALGRVQRTAEDLPAARLSLERAVEISRRSKDSAALATILMVLGRVAGEGGDFGSARSCFEEALGLGEKVEDRTGAEEARIALAGLIPRLGREQATIYESLGLKREAGRARKAASTAFRAALEPELERSQVGPLTSLARAAVESDPDLARMALERAKELVEGSESPRVSDRKLLGGAWHSYGMALERQERHDDAAAAFDIALSLAEDRPLAAAMVLHSIANQALLAGEPERAADLYRQAVERECGVGEGADPKSIAASLLGAGRSELAAKNFKAAQAAFEEREEWLASLPTPDPAEEGTTLHELGSLKSAEGDVEEAIALFRRALRRKREAPEGGRPVSVAATLLGLARAQVADKRLAEALASYQERMAVLGDLDDPDLAKEGQTLHEIGEVQSAEGHFEEALQSFEAAVKRKRSALGESAISVASSLLAVGRALRSLGRFGEARAVFEESLEILAALERPEPLAEGVTLHEIADLLGDQGEPDEAIEYYRRAAARKAEDPSDGPEVISQHASSLRRLAKLLEERGRDEESLKVREEAFEVIAALPEPSLQAEGVALHDIADIHFGRGEFERAVELYREAAERKRNDGRVPRDLAVTLMELGQALWQADEREQAVEAYREAADHLRDLVEDSNRRDLTSALLALGRAQLEIGEPEAARSSHEERLAILTGFEERDPQVEGVAVHDLADTYASEGELDVAVKLYREAVELKQSAEEVEVRDVATSQGALGRVLEQLEDFEGALRAYRDQLEQLRTLPEPDPLFEGVALHDIGDARRELGDFDGAIAAYREAGERKAESGRAHPGSISFTQLSLATTMVMAGTAAAEAGDEGGGIALLEEAECITEQVEDVNLLELGALRSLLADTLKTAGREEEAEAKHTQARAQLEAELATRPEVEPVNLKPLVLVCIASGALRLALQLTAQAREQFAAGNLESTDLATILLVIGRAIERRGKEESSEADLDAALAAYEERLELLSGAEQSSPQGEGVTLHDIANVQRAKGKLEEAADNYHRAAARKQEGKPVSRDVAFTLRCEAEVLLELERPRDALAAIERAERWVEDDDVAARDRARVKDVLAAVYTALGRERDAERAREQEQAARAAESDE